MMYDVTAEGPSVLRQSVVFLSVFVLTACSSEVTAENQQSDPVCMAQAKARADDAAVNGFGHGLQQKIYAEAYKDCVVWSSKSTIAGFR